jgi:hypothetical protein
MKPSRTATVAAVVLLAFSAPAAWADSLNPFPVRATDPQLRFEHLDDYPDWVFYVEYNRASEPPDATNLKSIRLTSDRPVALTGTGRHVRSRLVAVPRAKASTDDHFPPKGTPGVYRRELWIPDAAVFLLDFNDTYVRSYRVAILADDIRVEPIGIEPIRPEIDLGFTRLPVRQTGLLLAVVLAVGGVWMARRRRRRAAAERA